MALVVVDGVPALGASAPSDVLSWLVAGICSCCPNTTTDNITIAGCRVRVGRAREASCDSGMRLTGNCDLFLNFNYGPATPLSVVQPKLFARLCHSISYPIEVLNLIIRRQNRDRWRALYGHPACRETNSYLWSWLKM